MSKQHLRTIYQEDGCLLGVSAGKCYLVLGDITFRLDSNIYEPCLYIKGSDGTMVTIHHAFTVDTLCHAAETNAQIMMVTGNEYDIRGIIKLIRKAIDLSKETVDIGYVEGCCFMDYMETHGALSPETAVDLTDAGMKNPSLYTFIHSQKIGQTSDGLFYLIRPEKDSVKSDRFFRVISNQVRFGCGYRNHEGRRQYFAWHGYPNRNDDFFTTAEISEAEFYQIGAEYPVEISADRETAEQFRQKYVDRHPVILEGWNRLL